MKTKEFKARIKNGVIRIPKKYSEFENAEVEVRIVKQDYGSSKATNYDRKELEDLMSEIQNADPFKSIKDPSEWQRKLRSDWEKRL